LTLLTDVCRYDRGAKRFRDSEVLAQMLKKQKAGGKYFGGICTAPVDALYHHALLDGPAHLLAFNATHVL
jgi:putative intracellular protease/amidase